MPALRELQRGFRRALLDGDSTAIAELVEADGLDADERLDVYRNNIFASLTEVLKDTFPAVCRLVDERFFVYAASEFVRAAPPERACLCEYGARFPDFLAEFPPCHELVYLPDVARLEWLMNAAAHAVDAEPLAPAALAGIGTEETPRLMFRLHPALGLLASPWPVERIWHANRRDAREAGAIDLDAGGVRLEVSRYGEEVVFRLLDAPTFTFRQALHRGLPLEAAAEAALGLDPTFDLATAFADLFRDGAVIAFTLGPA